jgi:CBS domain-containing protein
MAIHARDLMQTSLVTLAPDEPVSEIQRVFAEEEIHGAPVVDQTGRLLGVVSTLDLLRAAVHEKETERETPSNFEEVFDLSRGEWSRFVESYRDRVQGLVAQDVMTEGVISVGLDAGVAEIARTLREERVHRVMVVEDGALRGVISTFDLIGLLEKNSG